MSFISKIGGQIVNAVSYSAIIGGVGYLGARVVKQVDPAAALICGMAAGGITALFFNHEMKSVGKIIGLALLIALPFKICEMLKIPAAWQACLIVTGLSTALALFIQHYQEESEFEDVVEKMDKEFDENVRRMKEQHNSAVEKMTAAFDQHAEEMKEKFKKSGFGSL